MADYTELKRLVDRVLTDRRFCGDENHKALAGGANALIAENERLERLALDSVNAEYAVGMDLESICAERDQLKAELEKAQLIGRLAYNFDGYKAVLDERDQLRAEVSGLKTGYEAYERVNAELKAENESLRKDMESHKRMLLAAACDLGAIGEALGAEMDDDGSELEGIATDLRKDAELLQSATAFVQKLCDSAGKQPSVATGYLHDILSALGRGEKS